MVKYLEKQPYETKVSTGETMVTPENMNEPEISKLIHPPQVENTTRIEHLGSQVEEMASDGDSQRGHPTNSGRRSTRARSRPPRSWATSR